MTSTTPRVAIYARHSSDLQNPQSSDDQLELCRRVAAGLGGWVVDTFADPEVSGYRRDRPGLQRMLREVAAGRIDIVVCESLDRIARDREDISWLGKKLDYHRVRLFTHLEREIDAVKLAVAGLLGSMFLSSLRQKTFRGQKAAVLAGRFAGGRAYGYRKTQQTDPSGVPLRGVMEIVPEEAEVVRRIHRDFADGRSSKAIATSLNREGALGPGAGNGTRARFAATLPSSSASSTTPSIPVASSGVAASGAAIPTPRRANGATGSGTARNGRRSKFPICALSTRR